MSHTPPNTKHFDELEAVLAQSFLARVVVTAAARVQRAIENSVVTSRIAKQQRQFAAFSHANRLRVIGVVIVSFGVTMAVLMAIIPLTSAPALPWGVWPVVAAGGVALLAAADAFAAAWKHRRNRRGFLLR